MSYSVVNWTGDSVMEATYEPYTSANMENLTNTTDLSLMIPSRSATALGATVMLVFFVIGMVGNAWILCAFMAKKNVWNVINIFVASLCINDLLSLCLTVILIIDSYFWRRWTAGDVMCKLGPEFTVAFTGSSLWHTALIAIHRYIVVVHNTFYKRMSRKCYVTFVLVTARIVPFACASPGFTLKTSGYMEKLLRCVFLPSQGGRIISVTVIQIILPCIIVVLCYALIFGFVFKVFRQVQDSNLILQREIQITKMFGVVFLMILVGFIPYAVIRNADKNNTLSADMYVIVTVFYGVATCSNPFIYGAMSTDIRNTCYHSLMELIKFCGFQDCMKCFSDRRPSKADMSIVMDTDHIRADEITRPTEPTYNVTEIGHLQDESEIHLNQIDSQEGLDLDESAASGTIETSVYV